MACSDAAQWEAVCEEEIHAFQRLGIYKVVPRLKGWKVVGSKWVFKVKKGLDGQIIKYKARVVHQENGKLLNLS
jgi:hypothetical protein